jgi:hypothetical protein
MKSPQPAGGGHYCVLSREFRLIPGATAILLRVCLLDGWYEKLAVLLYAVCVVTVKASSLS